MKIFSDLWQIAKKDLKEFSRDRLRLVTFFIMPIFMMIMVGYIFPNQNSLKQTPLGITNQDKGTVGKTLIEMVSKLKFDDNLAFEIKDYSDTETIKDGIKNQEISGGLSIPENFSSKIKNNQPTQALIIEDQSNPQVSQMINGILGNLVTQFSQQVGSQKVNQILIQQQAINPPTSLVDQAKAIVVPIRSKLEGIIPGNPNYFEFVAPGIMAMIVMTAVLTGLAASIAREKEQGTLDGILISPINRLAIILGKALAQAIRGLVQGAIVLLLAAVLFGVTIHGSILLVALLLLLGIFSFVGLGILVSAFATEQETATQLLFMFQFPMLFLSGVFFPIILMPDFMQKISKAIPLTYAITALRKVMVLGAGIGAVRTEILLLVAFGIITLAISVPVFKRVITK